MFTQKVINFEDDNENENENEKESYGIKFLK